MEDITTRDLDEIREFLMFAVMEFPHTITWSITPKEIIKICELVKQKNYRTIKELYGNDFLVVLRTFNEELENYEECIKINLILDH